MITFPSGGQRLPGAGCYEISGLAWSGAGAIRRVEVSTDGGQHWHDAELRSPAYPMAHTRFGFPWEWDRKECVQPGHVDRQRGTLQPDEVHALTAFLLYKNGVIHEDDVMDAHSLPEVAMHESPRLRDAGGAVDHGSPRLQGYPKPPQQGGAHGEDGLGAIDGVIDQNLSARRAGEWSSAACAGRRRARTRTPL